MILLGVLGLSWNWFGYPYTKSDQEAVARQLSLQA